MKPNPFISAVLSATLLLTGCETVAPSSAEPTAQAASANAESAPAADTTSASVYQFGRGELPLEQSKPRGGSSRGAPVEYTAQDDSLPARIAALATVKERDRAAILALAGDYRVDFHFMEIASLIPDYELGRPYYSWATEQVRILAAEEDFISLQHTLVIFFKQDDGSISDPMLVKHWRQDWTYEDTELHTYRGSNVWARETRDPESVAGAWTQSVWQVDDSPRYEVVGRWEHHGNQSVWSSENFWRPLPRREHSVRDDYLVMEGTHRIRLTPAGWVHEQRSLKRVEGDEELASPTYLSEELGLSHYVRVDSPELTAADDYWDATGYYWAEVRAAWEDVMASNDRFKLLPKVNDKRLFEVHFAYAGEIQEDDTLIEEDGIIHAHETVESFVQPLGK